MTLFLAMACNVPPPRIRVPRRYDVEHFKTCPTFDVLFRDMESVAFVSDTGETISFTSYQPHDVSFSTYYYMDVINQELMKINKTIAEVDLIVHNHFKYTFFSPADIHFLNRMKINGFEGMFAIYFVPLKTVMIYTEMINKEM